MQTSLLILGFVVLLAGGASGQTSYDPLEVPAGVAPEALDLSVHDQEREREIPIRVYLPSGASPAPVVLFSHGLGGSREGSAYLGDHWAARGYLVVYLQHPGSDTSVWQDVPRWQRLRAMEGAASAENFMLRVWDVAVVLDQLEVWNGADGHVLAGRLDMDKVGMSGHSFGAETTQAVGGQAYGRGNLSFTDPRIKAAMAFSPSVPRRGDPERAFGRVVIPWMLMTGTRDESIISDASAESRLLVFPALPPGGKYELVLDRAEHSAFSDRALPGDTEPRNPNHHRAILALSTAFWDAWLRQDAAARSWLDDEGPRSVLEPGDRWRTK